MNKRKVTTYLTEEELAFALTVTVCHDCELDIGELKEKIVKALEKDHLECSISEIPDPVAEELPEKYPGIL